MILNRDKIESRTKSQDEKNAPNNMSGAFGCLNVAKFTFRQATLPRYRLP